MSIRAVLDRQAIKALPHRLATAAVCGNPATTINMAMLAMLGAAGIRAAHGGLLRLLALGSIRIASSLGINVAYREQAQVVFVTRWFQNGLHIVTGLLMTLVYVFFLEPRRGASRHVLWRSNIGEGIARKQHLTVAGMSGFASAHMRYFVVLSLLAFYMRRLKPTGQS